MEGKNRPGGVSSLLAPGAHHIKLATGVLAMLETVDAGIGVVRHRTGGALGKSAVESAGIREGGLLKSNMSGSGSRVKEQSLARFRGRQGDYVCYPTFWSEMLLEAGPSPSSLISPLFVFAPTWQKLNPTLLVRVQLVLSLVLPLSIRFLPLPPSPLGHVMSLVVSAANDSTSSPHVSPTFTRPARRPGSEVSGATLLCNTGSSSRGVSQRTPNLVVPWMSPAPAEKTSSTQWFPSSSRHRHVSIATSGTKGRSTAASKRYRLPPRPQPPLPPTTPLQLPRPPFLLNWSRDMLVLPLFSC
ncbi:hypothetical protein C8R45DRAFT_1167843, partial [Mycena sanguinolenta]